VTFENSPSKVAEADQPFIHFISADAVTSAESDACAAPLTTKDAPDPTPLAGLPDVSFAPHCT
jgi:hypothetical protein